VRLKRALEAMANGGVKVRAANGVKARARCGKGRGATGVLGCKGQQEDGGALCKGGQLDSVTGAHFVGKQLAQGAGGCPQLLTRHGATRIYVNEEVRGRALIVALLKSHGRIGKEATASGGGGGVALGRATALQGR